MEALCLKLSIHSSVGLSVCLFTNHLFLCCQTCEHDILKMNKQILMQVGTSSPRGKGMKRSALGSGGQMLGSRKAEDRCEGLTEASFLPTLWSSRFSSFCLIY